MTRRSGAGTLAVAMLAAMVTGSMMLNCALSVFAKIGLACSSQMSRALSPCAAESAEPGTSPDEGMANTGCECRWARARMAGLRWTLAAWCAACSASPLTASTKRAKILIGQASSVARVERVIRWSRKSHVGEKTAGQSYDIYLLDYDSHYFIEQ